MALGGWLWTGGSGRVALGGWLWAGGSGRRSALGRRSCAPQSPRETERQTDRRQRGAGDHPIQVAWLLGEHERLAEARANAAMEELLAEEAAAAAAQQQQQQQQAAASKRS